jgi:uncharacterized protein YcfJ
MNTCISDIKHPARKLLSSVLALAVAGSCLTTTISCTADGRFGAVIGAIGGAAAGGIIGHQRGRGIEGAVAGGAIGAALGGLIGEEIARSRATQYQLAHARAKTKNYAGRSGTYWVDVTEGPNARSSTSRNLIKYNARENKLDRDAVKVDVKNGGGYQPGSSLTVGGTQGLIL